VIIPRPSPDCKGGDMLTIWLRQATRNAAVDFAVEVLDDFGAPLIPPHFGGRDFFPVF
jgi:hypothetical protein